MRGSPKGSSGLVAPSRTAASHLSVQRLRGFVRRPTVEQVKELAALEFFHFTDEEAATYAAAIDSVLSLVDQLDDLQAPMPALRHLRRDPGRIPSPEENPFNAIMRLCRIEGASGGRLAGVTVGVKDNIAVAGVPVTNGARIAAYVPVSDASVVERLLDAGATITAKLNMDDFGSAGTGETSVIGPVRNPLDPRRSAGGSSSGAGAAVVSGVVDLAIGVDQGGSARIPAAFCGAVGLKPTHGLVPSHGVTHIDHTIDYVCPVARSVELTARALDVMAGDDWRDPQWIRGQIPTVRTIDSLEQGVRGLRVGVVRESIEDVVCEPEVIEGLNRAADMLASAGAEVRQISIPLWKHAWAIEVTLLCQFVWAMAQSEGQGWGHLGLNDVDRAHVFALARRLEADNFAPLHKVWMLVGRYLHDTYLSTYLGKAGNLRLALRGEISGALSACDLLITPTTPGVAPVLAEPPVTDAELLARGTTMSANTCPLNLSGHPALAVPVQSTDGSLPLSVQLIAPHFRDDLALRAGRVLHG